MKKIATVLSAIAITLTLSTFPVHAAPIPKVVLNGSNVNFDNAPFMDESGYMLVEFRPLFEKLGLKVGYDSKTQTITGDAKNFHAFFQIGVKVATVNNNTFNLPVAPRIINGHAMVPLRFLSEAVGDTVKWDGATMTASLTGQIQNTPADYTQSAEQVDPNAKVVKVTVNGEDIQDYTDIPSIRVNNIVFVNSTITQFFHSSGDHQFLDKANNVVKLTHDNQTFNVSYYTYNAKTLLSLDDIAKITGATVVDNGDNVQVTIPTTAGTTK